MTLYEAIANAMYEIFDTKSYLDNPEEVEKIIEKFINKVNWNLKNSEETEN